jgi:hypothetical protein
VLREMRAMDDQEVKIEEALELYYRAAEEFNSLLGGSVPYEVVRDLRVSALLVLHGYRHKDNWNDRRPIITIPPEMALDLAEDIDSVLRGHIPSWMLHMQRRGAPKRYPAIDRDIETAVLYHALSERGIIETEPQPRPLPISLGSRGEPFSSGEKKPAQGYSGHGSLTVLETPR